MFKLILKIRQHFCKHKYVKHYDPAYKKAYSRNTGAYVYRCPKCGKVVIP